MEPGTTAFSLQEPACLGQLELEKAVISRQNPGASTETGPHSWAFGTQTGLSSQEIITLGARQPALQPC